jgi:RNA polymerase sigma factor (sigma-70 family)
MLGVKEGDLSELTELFERYHVKLYNFFLRLTFDKAASEDLTQNLFYRIIKYRHTYRPGDGSFRSWVYQMARNVHFDYCKQQRKTAEQFKTGDFEQENLLKKEENYTEDDFVRLDHALLQLLPEQREIILLSRYQGLRYTEISKIKGSSVTAIKVQIYRAMKQLRNIYFKTQ